MSSSFLSKIHSDFSLSFFSESPEPPGDAPDGSDGSDARDDGEDGDARYPSARDLAVCGGEMRS